GDLGREGARMAVQPQIAYRDVEPSPALERLIQAETAKLERFFHGIVTCRVLIEHSHRRHKHGSPFNVRIDLSLPGAELVVNHSDDVRPVPPASDDEPERVHKSAEREGHKDPQLAVRAAFATLTRRLQEHVKQLRP
ncbi:MAG: HPF/RaiA family ribosome-associated protein, partial [Candidatus Eremiobacteraeota bacterium]|nr:HPF/RaiA family ribosome-associated protein [Candidatus Eremiobacteraeota bacterium]